MYRHGFYVILKTFRGKKKKKRGWSKTEVRAGLSQVRSSADTKLQQHCWLRGGEALLGTGCEPDSYF